jgi:hypothetical protein
MSEYDYDYVDDAWLDYVEDQIESKGFIWAERIA